MIESTEASQEKTYQKLVSNLEDLTKHYRVLLEIVRKEKELLLQADIEKLNENNKGKESLLYKVRSLDSARERYARELAYLIGADTEAPRLLEIAQKVESVKNNRDQADRLRTIHSTLEILIKRIYELNKENAQYAQSGLNVLNGAMNDIKETLSGKKTYEKKGKIAYGPEQSGNFVSKEV